VVAAEVVAVATMREAFSSRCYGKTLTYCFPTAHAAHW
jgi:hypothetical protein